MNRGPENLIPRPRDEIFGPWSCSGSGSEGNWGYKGRKQDLGLFPRFVSVERYRPFRISKFKTPRTIQAVCYAMDGEPVLPHSAGDW
jgi:hypothetical protein